MPIFRFEAVDATGARARGREEASDIEALARTLERRGLFLLDTRADDQPAPPALAFRRRREVLEFTRAMAALLPAGLPLARALASASEVTSGRVRHAVDDARARVNRGEPLAASLGAWPACFSPLYTGLVRAGEQRGELAAVFARLSDQLEREEQWRGRLLSALLYPLLLGIAGAAAIVVLLVVVLPQFSVVLVDAGATLPRSTQLLLAVAAAARAAWPLLVALPVAAVVIVTVAQRRESGRRRLSQMLLALPLVGTLRRQVLGARVARLLGVLLGGGAPLLAALEDVVASLDDPVARETLVAVRARVRDGTSLRDALAAEPLFPPLLAQLTGVGEESSRLREFLLKTADILDERAARTAQRVTTLAEPVMIVVFGAIVALIAFSLLQAIYSVNAGTFVR